MGGIYRNDTREDWELAKVSKLLAHNNAVERPFAVAKAYLDCFPTMKLSTLVNYSLALTNGSHQSVGTIGKMHENEIEGTKTSWYCCLFPIRVENSSDEIVWCTRCLTRSSDFASSR